MPNRILTLTMNEQAFLAVDLERLVQISRGFDRSVTLSYCDNTTPSRHVFPNEKHAEEMTNFVIKNWNEYRSPKEEK